MRFNNHRTAGGQCGSCIAARDRKCQREITRAENGHWSKRDQHGAHVWFGHGFAIGIAVINPGIEPPTVLDERRKEAQLAASARGLALETGEGQSRLLVSAVNNSGGIVFKQLCDTPEEGGTSFGRPMTVLGERLGGEVTGLVNVLL